jgi:multimeric flavodoxin WrbA
MLAVVRIGWSESEQSRRMDAILASALDGVPHESYSTMHGLLSFLDTYKLGERAILFAVALPLWGVTASYARFLRFLVQNDHCFEGCWGGVMIDGPDEFFTKKVGREMVSMANRAGCSFPGKPLVEATGSLYNFNTQAMVQGIHPFEAYEKSAHRLILKITDKMLQKKSSLPQGKKPYIVALHASSRKTSNTLLLWEMVRQSIGDRAQVNEISLRNGSVIDCRGCSYEACLHFGEKGDCFYGGVMVDEVYPAVRQCDALVLICPNYNDAVSANITAFINRLTALFRKEGEAFADKKVYGLIVSGYSGGDIVAEQIIDAMNCNKNFILPGRFALVETANAPKSILRCNQIHERAAAFADHIVGQG